jgi:hypothetical protein
MNRLAIVLAADSASTVTQWTEKGSGERYFKGSNKIFQLSDHHPVGLMIFASSDILRVPWEIVVKAFRNELGKKSFNSLLEYAAEFFSFRRMFRPFSRTRRSVFILISPIHMTWSCAERPKRSRSDWMPCSLASHCVASRPSARPRRLFADIVASLDVRLPAKSDAIANVARRRQRITRVVFGSFTGCPLMTPTAAE